jgi:TonB family protein
MDELDKTAQERLQEKALRNTRALLDQLEKPERRPSMGMVIGVVLVVFAIGFGILAANRRDVYREPSRPTQDMSAAEYTGYYLDRLARKTNLQRTKVLEGERTPIEMEMSVGRNGRAQVKVLKSTGNSQLDDAYIAAVKLAEPFGPPPRTDAHVINARLAFRDSVLVAEPL